MRLLIVDDSNVVRTRIARITGSGALADMQIVGMARNGVEALKLQAQFAPDIVTMDLTMPEMDGVECTQQMVQAKPDIKILVISALADKNTAIKALRKGANGFLYKPFTDKELLSAFQELMEIA